MQTTRKKKVLPNIKPIFGNIEIEIWQIDDDKPLYNLKGKKFHHNLETRKGIHVID